MVRIWFLIILENDQKEALSDEKEIMTLLEGVVSDSSLVNQKNIRKLMFFIYKMKSGVYSNIHRIIIKFCSEKTKCSHSENHKKLWDEFAEVFFSKTFLFNATYRN